MARYMNRLRFGHIKTLLGAPGASIASVAKRTQSSWDTIKRVSIATSFDDYRPSTKIVPGSPETTASKLRAERDRVLKEFDTAIRLAERYKL